MKEIEGIKIAAKRVCYVTSPVEEALHTWILADLRFNQISPDPYFERRGMTPPDTTRAAAVAESLQAHPDTSNGHAKAAKAAPTAEAATGGRQGLPRPPRHRQPRRRRPWRQCRRRGRRRRRPSPRPSQPVASRGSARPAAGSGPRRRSQAASRSALSLDQAMAA